MKAAVPPRPAPPLDLTLEEYFAAAAATGLLAAQLQEPDPEWCAEWAMAFGVAMARKAMARRKAQVSRRQTDREKSGA